MATKTGEKNIYINTNNKDKKFMVQLTIKGKRFTKSFYTLEEAVAYRNSIKQNLSKNEIIKDEKNNIAYIILKNKEKEIVGKAIIDLDDIELIKDYGWYLNNKGYVVATKGSNCERLWLHRIVIGATDDIECVDHIDRNPLNNTKSNLRPCTNTENKRNNSRKTKETASKSGYKNIEIVYGGKYRVSISCNGKRYKSTSFETLEEALIWRNEKMNELHKEFTNFGEEGVYDG